MAKGITYLLKKNFEDRGIFSAWDARLGVTKTQIREAIASGDSEKIQAVFPSVRFLFDYLPDFLLLRGQGTIAAPTWARDKFYPILADTLFPTYEQFITGLQHRMDRVANSTSDVNDEIKSINEELGDLRLALWKFEKKQYGFNAYLSPFTRMEIERDEKGRKEAVEQMNRLESRRVQLRAQRDVTGELDRLLANYLGNLPEAQQARKLLAEVGSPELFTAFFEDQFLNTRTDEWNRPLAAGTFAGSSVVLSPKEIIDDLNELARGTTPVIDVHPTIALGFIDDLIKVCKVSVDPAFSENTQKLYESTIVKAIRTLEDRSLRWLVGWPPVRHSGHKLQSEGRRALLRFPYALAVPRIDLKER